MSRISVSDRESMTKEQLLVLLDRALDEVEQLRQDFRDSMAANRQRIIAAEEVKNA